VRGGRAPLILDFGTTLKCVSASHLGFFTHC